MHFVCLYVCVSVCVLVGTSYLISFVDFIYTWVFLFFLLWLRVRVNAVTEHNNKHVRAKDFTVFVRRGLPKVLCLSKRFSRSVDAFWKGFRFVCVLFAGVTCFLICLLCRLLFCPRMLLFQTSDAISVACSRLFLKSVKPADETFAPAK